MAVQELNVSRIRSSSLSNIKVGSARKLAAVHNRGLETLTFDDAGTETPLDRGGPGGKRGSVKIYFFTSPGKAADLPRRPCF